MNDDKTQRWLRCQLRVGGKRCRCSEERKASGVSTAQGGPGTQAGISRGKGFGVREGEAAAGRGKGGEMQQEWGP